MTSATAFTLLRAAYRAYLEWQPDGDGSTFLDWVKDELPVVTGRVPAEERTGLDCPDCGVKQKRLDIQREPIDGDPKGGLFVRINYKIPVEKLASEVKGLCALLKRFAD